MCHTLKRVFLTTIEMYPFNHHINVRAWVSILIKAPTLSPGGSPPGGQGA